MTQSDRRNSPILVEMTPELAAFVVENCESNMEFGLQALGTLSSPDLLQQMVSNIENFKLLRAATKKAVEGE